MDKYTKVEGHASLVRSKSSGAIINTNSHEMSQARHRKKVWKDQQEELQNLRSDVAVMKEMLQQLLEEKNGNNNS
jgi:hypothetical protein